MRTIKTSAGRPVELDGDVLAVIEAVWSDLISRKSLDYGFEDVNGDLNPERLVRGFSLRDADQNDLGLVFEAMPDPRQPGSVLVLLRAPVPEGSSLWYGWGPDPVCTLTDSEGMAAPAFGPVKL